MELYVRWRVSTHYQSRVWLTRDDRGGSSYARIYQDIDPLSNPKFVMAGHQDGVMFFGRDIEEAMGEVMTLVLKSSTTLSLSD